MQGLRAASRCASEAVRTMYPLGEQALQSETCSGRCRPPHIHHLNSVIKAMSSAAGCSLKTTAALFQEKPTEAQRAVWHTLSLSQKRAILRPNKGRKHFDRMWEKDAQIKVRASCLKSCVCILLQHYLCLQEAHQTRQRHIKLANMSANAKRQRTWGQMARLWRQKPPVAAEAEVS